MEIECIKQEKPRDARLNVLLRTIVEYENEYLIQK